jgi:hypothetical protein
VNWQVSGRKKKIKPLRTTVVCCVEKLKEDTQFSVRVNDVAEFIFLDLLQYDAEVNNAISSII